MHAIRTMMSAAAVFALAAGCSTTPKTMGAKDDRMMAADQTLKAYYDLDSSFGDFIKNSAGYVVFPEIGKGGFIVGGGGGTGVVYRGGNAVGYAQVVKVNVGGVVGGQTLSEVIVFQNKQALLDFMADKLTLAADATAVAIKKGAASSAAYNKGVVVFADSKAGLMADASVGGQSFHYEPMK